MPLEVLGGVMGAVVGFYLIAPLFPFLYVMLRWTSGAAGEPGIGTHGAFHYFRSLAVVGACSGISMCLFALLKKGEGEFIIRPSLGLLAAAIFFYFLNFLCSQKMPPTPTNHPVRRIFDGFLLVLSGLVSFVALIVFFIELLDKRVDAEVLKGAGSWGTIWLVAFFWRAYLLVEPIRRP
ncbi:MAG: hypothetical protein ACT4PV_10480 [Planctomycetaceae bacterium]